MGDKNVGVACPPSPTARPSSDSIKSEICPVFGNDSRCGFSSARVCSIRSLKNTQFAVPDSAINFHVACELDYTLHDPATFLFAIQCLETRGQQILRETLSIEPWIAAEEFSLSGGLNRFSRLTTVAPGQLKIAYHATVRSSSRVVSVSTLSTDTAATLMPEAIPLLLPSRYCQSDRLRQMANTLFGHCTTQHAIAAAVSDWIFENVAYVSGSSGENCSAIDTLEHRQGVCRDFAHLAIAFCRALNLPARYMTCYAYQLAPQDFHACFEVFIGGTWYLFDATQLAPLNGLIRIATGRDAADAAVCTSFGNPEFTRSLISCECREPDFIAVTRDHLAARNEAIFLPSA